jgi:hypothetical protein
MVLLSKRPIAMSNPPLHFFVVVYRLEVMEQVVDLVMSLWYAAHSVNELHPVLLRVGETPATYAYEEYADLVFVYGSCNGNERTTVDEFRRRYPHCIFLHQSTSASVCLCRRETGSCPRANREHVQQRPDADVLNAVQGSPSSHVCTEFRAQPLK